MLVFSVRHIWKPISFRITYNTPSLLILHLTFLPQSINSEIMYILDSKTKSYQQTKEYSWHASLRIFVKRFFVSAEELLPSGTLYQFKTKVILTSDGGCSWFAPTILRSGCNIDITYFPFDDQMCELKFGSWTYHGLEVNIVQMRDSADLKFYMKSSEFELISAKAKRNVAKYR